MKMSRLSQLLDNNNKDSEMPVYQSTSCDEIAFVKAAARRGIIFYGEEGNELVIRLPDGQTVVYEKLQVLEFTSARKMMSIIVRDGNGKVRLL